MKFRRLIVLLCFFLCAISLPTSSKIKHVVVLMFENRSFDHMLGYLKKLNPKIDGLTGEESNPWNPSDPNSKRVKVSFDSPDNIQLNPGHSIRATETEIWDSTMEGFLKEIQSSSKCDPSLCENVMKSYNTTSLPALSTLAMEFATFDRWYSSVPGPTQPNRMFFHTGTSHGVAHNDILELIKGYPQRTIYDDLYDSGLDFKIYFSDFPISLILRNLRSYPLHIKHTTSFYQDCKDGTLPAFSFVEPRWFDFLEWEENDQHPPYTASQGEFLVKDVYESLRNSPAWNDTLLIITYDEHGGLYDHVPPPVNVPNPDGKVSTDPSFDFTRLGVRVPTVMISPWIDSNTVIHEPKRNHFDHTSVLATIRKMFNLKQGPLTKREEWAATFEFLFENRTHPRTDCPMTIPVPPGYESSYKKYKRIESMKESMENIQEMLLKNPNPNQNSPPINDLQREIIEIAWSVNDPQKPMPIIKTVHEAAVFVRQQMKQFYQLHGVQNDIVTLNF